MSVRAVVVDDHELMRQGLCVLLDGEPDIEVVGQAADGRSALTVVRQSRPDVVIMDITMADLNGVEATRRIREELPGAKVIALSMHTDRRSVLGMLDAGARAYVTKSGAFRELAQAVEAVMGGLVYLSPKIAALVVDERHHGTAEGAPGASPLSPREREVLQLIAEGRTTRDIAARLFLSPKTVQSHRQRIMDKLGLHTAAELTKYAVMEGLTPPEP